MGAPARKMGGDSSLGDRVLDLRASLFRLFGSVLIEPTEEVLRAMAMPELSEGVEFVYGHEGSEVFGELAERCRDSSCSEIAKEQDRLFNIPTPGFIPPFASAFQQQEGRRRKKGYSPLMGKPALDAIALMRRMDLELDMPGVLPDHAGVLLTLYGELLRKKKERRPESALSEGLNLLETPLYKWLHVFFERVSQATAAPFWKAFAEAVPVFIRQERDKYGLIGDEDYSGY